jgi:thiol-disulfide isomerase/thioredoxin
MDPALALVVLVALIAVATVAGLVWKRATGRVRPRIPGEATTERVRPADVGTTRPFGESGTLLQFSTEFCTYCPATRRLLSRLADSHDGLVHIDVDLTHAAEIARRFNILQTPTTLVLDATGAVRARVGGPPKPRELQDTLTRMLGEHHVAP